MVKKKMFKVWTVAVRIDSGKIKVREFKTAEDAIMYCKKQTDLGNKILTIFAE